MRQTSRTIDQSGILSKEAESVIIDVLGLMAMTAPDWLLCLRGEVRRYLDRYLCKHGVWRGQPLKRGAWAKYRAGRRWYPNLTLIRDAAERRCVDLPRNLCSSLAIPDRRLPGLQQDLQKGKSLHSINLV